MALLRVTELESRNTNLLQELEVERHLASCATHNAEADAENESLKREVEKLIGGIASLEEQANTLKQRYDDGKLVHTYLSSSMTIFPAEIFCHRHLSRRLFSR